MKPITLVLVVCLCVLSGTTLGGNKPKPKVCVRVDDNIEKIVSSRLEEFRGALLRPLEKHGIDASICPKESQPMELHYSADIVHDEGKTIYKTENVPGGSYTTPIDIPPHSRAMWHLYFYGGGIVEKWEGINLDGGNELMAKWIEKHIKKIKQ